MSTAATKHIRLINDLDIVTLIFTAIGHILGLVATAGRIVLTWIRRYNERRALTLLNDRTLSDIGLSHADVHREASKFFWQK